MASDKKNNTEMGTTQDDNCPTFEIFTAHNIITSNPPPACPSEKNISSDGKSGGENNQK